MVIDSSALLELWFDGPHAGWVARELSERARELRISAVSLSEALAVLRDRQPQLADTIADELVSSGIRIVAAGPEHAVTAAALCAGQPLGMGGCYAYALAKAENCAVLAVRKGFDATDCELISPGSP